ncbi:MAG: hypothetical protein IKZ92_09775 [Muribaculaceae bacterium]|nr:hypothetical protein [Muribaculaceae bacterium]
MKGKFRCSLPWLPSCSRGKHGADGRLAAKHCGETFHSSVLSDGYSSARLFLPAAGNRWNDSLNNAGSNGYYLSRTLNSNNPNNAYNLNFNSGNWNNWNNNYNRNNGYTVRAVRVS